MTYNVKDVFYLDMTMTMPTATTVGKSNTAQLDLSAYIDPIARGRSKFNMQFLELEKVIYLLIKTILGYLELESLLVLV